MNKDFSFLIEILKEEILKTEELIRKGLDYKKIKKKIEIKELEISFLDKKINIKKRDIFELAKGLIYAKKKKDFDFIFVKEKDAKYMFNKKIAELRADYLREFLKNKTFADLSCGYGIQSLLFLKYAKEAIFIDKNLETLFYAFLNSILFQKNEKIKFVNTDSENLKEEEKKTINSLDFIYFEPYRENEKLSPSLKNLDLNKKSIVDLPKRYYKDYKKLIKSCIEDEKGVNRVTIFKNIDVDPFYIVKRKKSVFLLKNNENNKKEIKNPETFSENEFLDELNKKAIFFEYFESAIFLDFIKKYVKVNKTYLGFKEQHVKNKFEVVSIIEEKKIKEKEKKAKERNEKVKVILRFKLDPKEYHKEKEKFEKLINTNNINGEIHIFKIKDKLVIAKKLN